MLLELAELQQRDTIQYHCLIGWAGNIRQLSCKDFWELNGFARVGKYELARVLACMSASNMRWELSHATAGEHLESA